MSWARKAVSMAAASAPYALQRSVYLRVHPAPENLAERRAVLRLLERHGEVEVFKKLRAHRNSFISVMASPSAASDLVSRSPITYELITEKHGSPALRDSLEITAAVQPIETTGSGSDSKRPKSGDTADSGPRDQSRLCADPGRPLSGSGGRGLEHGGTAALNQKSFVLHAFQTAKYSHRESIRSAPLWRHWPAEPVAGDLFVYKALRAVVPRGPAHNGLCDWYTGKQLVESEGLPRRIRAESNGNGFQDGHPGNAHPYD